MSNIKKNGKMNTKITQHPQNQMFIVWIFKKRNTGIKCIDQNKQWLIHSSFFTLNDAIKCASKIDSSK